MVLLEMSMFPLDKGESLSPYVARSLEIIDASGLDYRLGAMGTTLEGPFDEVMGVVKRCFEAMAADCDRIVSLLERFGLPTRTDASKTDLIDAFRQDKKREGGDVYFVMLERIGKPRVEKIPLAELADAIQAI